MPERTPPPNTPIITGLRIEYFSSTNGGNSPPRFSAVPNWNLPDVKVRAGYIKSAQLSQNEFDLYKFNAKAAKIHVDVSGSYSNITNVPQYSACSSFNSKRKNVMNYVRNYLASNNLYTNKWKPEVTTGNKKTREFTVPDVMSNAEDLDTVSYSDFFTLTTNGSESSSNTITATVGEDSQEDLDDLRRILRYIADNILFPDHAGTYKVFSHVYNNRRIYEKTEWGKFHDNDANVLKSWVDLIMKVRSLQSAVFNRESRLMDVTIKKYKMKNLWVEGASTIPGSGLRWSADIFDGEGWNTATEEHTLYLSGTTSEINMQTLYGISQYEVNTFCDNEGDFLAPHVFMSEGTFNYDMTLQVYGYDKPSMCIPEYLEFNVGDQVFHTMRITSVKACPPEPEWFEYKLYDDTRDWGVVGKLQGPNNLDCGIEIRRIFAESALGGRSYTYGFRLEGVAARPGIYWVRIGMKTRYMNVKNRGMGPITDFMGNGDLCIEQAYGGDAYADEFIVIYIRPTDYRPGDLVACIPASVYQADKHYLAISHSDLPNWEFQEHAEDNVPESEWVYVSGTWDNAYPSGGGDDGTAEFNTWVENLKKSVGISNTQGSTHYTNKTVQQYIGEADGRTHTPGYWYKLCSYIDEFRACGVIYKYTRNYFYVITLDADKKWRLYCASNTEWHLTDWVILAEATDTHNNGDVAGTVLTDVQPPLYWKSVNRKRGVLCLRGSESFVISAIMKGKEYEPLESEDNKAYGGVYSYIGKYEDSDHETRDVFQQQPLYIKAHDYNGHKNDSNTNFFTNEDNTLAQVRFEQDAVLYTKGCYLYLKDISTDPNNSIVEWVLSTDLKSIDKPGVVKNKEYLVKVSKAAHCALPYNPMRPEKFLGGNSNSNIGDIGFFLNTSYEDKNMKEHESIAPMSVSNWSGEDWGHQRYDNPLGVFGHNTITLDIDTNNAIQEANPPTSTMLQFTAGGMIWHYYPMLRGKNLSNLRMKCEASGRNQAYGSWANCPFGPEVNYSIVNVKQGSPAGNANGTDDIGLPNTSPGLRKRLMGTRSSSTPQQWSDTVTTTYNPSRIDSNLNVSTTPKYLHVWSNNYMLQGRVKSSSPETISDNEAASMFSGYGTSGSGTLKNVSYTYDISMVGMMAYSQVPSTTLDEDDPDGDPILDKKPTQCNIMNIKASMRITGEYYLGDVKCDDLDETLEAEWTTNVFSDADGRTRIAAQYSDEQREFEYTNYSMDGAGDDSYSRQVSGNCTLSYKTIGVSGRSNRTDVEQGMIPDALVKYPLIDDIEKKVTYSITDDGITSTYIYEGNEAQEAYAGFRDDLDGAGQDFDDLEFPGYNNEGLPNTTSKTISGIRIDSMWLKKLAVNIVMNYGQVDDDDDFGQ